MCSKIDVPDEEVEKEFKIRQSEVIGDPRDSLQKYARHFQISLREEKFAQEMDDLDHLAEFQDSFYIPKANFEDLKASRATGKNMLYFAGNSLGLQPRTVNQYIQEELDEWKKRAVEAHFHHSKER